MEKKTVNREYYIGLFEDLKAEVVKKGRKELKSTKTMDRVTSCWVRWQKFHELYFKLLPYPSYCLDLAPKDYYLFSNIITMLELRPVFSLKVNRPTRNV